MIQHMPRDQEEERDTTKQKEGRESRLATAGSLLGRRITMTIRFPLRIEGNALAHLRAWLTLGMGV